MLKVDCFPSMTHLNLSKGRISISNERKPLVGKLVVNKTDSNGTPVAGATFTLNRLNEETNQYEPIMYDHESNLYASHR